jgi:hypothetical protein
MSAIDITEAPSDTLYLGVLTAKLIDDLEKGYCTTEVVRAIGEEIARIRASGEPS